MPDDWENGGFGVYIHWPFCQAKCPYCDFNSHVSRQIDQKQWLAAYLSELDRNAAETPGRVVSSVFFGGGTPSLMEPEVVADIIDRINTLWPRANDPEITLEANPGSIESSRFRDYRSAGVTRVSMGLQALNDRDLQRLGRIHTVDEALRAFDIARDTFDRVSFDMIYARQDQTPQDWRQELTRALSYAIDHISLYQLTIEQGTAFGDRYNIGKLRGLPNDDDAAEMYDITQEVTEKAGYLTYEVSNHAKPGAESRHNSLYWRYGDYIGIGPGAHGRITLNHRRTATEAIRMPNAWLSAALAGNGDASRESLSQDEEITEFLLMGMRLAEGIDLTRYEALSGRPLSPSSISNLNEIGMTELSGTRLRATRDGRMVLNSVIGALLE
ncbi:radical SAM family heme chaperone HemW [Pseudooceanicola sp. C21-150M6]|uniref:radical SAM family heme chaperone HemW n=1 Tax=Pseudooceanicola sp. C21-150M6 TaxID=3434355 RepID=UPI003D7F6424